MIRFQNFLTLLAAFLKLTAGCGLRSSGISGQGLLRLGARLATQRLAATNTGGTLQGILGGSSAGGLVGNIGSLGSGGLTSGLVSGSSGLMISGTTSELGGGPGGGSGGGLLADLGKLARERLNTRVSSGGILSGSGISSSGGHPGIQPGQVLQASGQMASAGFIAAASTASSASRFTTNLAQNPTGNVNAIGMNPSGGGVLGSSLINSGGSLLQGVGQGALQSGQSIGRGTVITASTVTNSAASVGAQLAGNAALQSQPVIPSLTDGSPATVVLSGGSRPGSSGVSAGLGTRHESLGAVLAAGTRGNLMDVLGPTAPGGLSAQGSSGSPVSDSSSLSSGRNQVPGFVQGVQQTNQLVAREVIQTAGSAATTVGGLGANVLGNTIGNSVRGIPSQNGGVPLRGALNEDTAFASSVVQSGVGRGAGALETINGVGTLSGLRNGNGGRPASGPHGAGTSAGNLVSGTAILTEQGLVQGSRQINQALGGGMIGNGGAALQSAARATTRMAGNSATTLLNAASSLRDVSSAAAPGASIGQGPRGAGSGPGPLAGQGLMQGTHQFNQAIDGGIISRGAAALQSTASMTAETAGSSTRTLLGIATGLGGASSAVSPGGSMGPAPSEVGSVNNLGQGLGQRSPQAGQPFGGTMFGAGGTHQQSATSISSQVSGSFPGGSPGQGSFQGPHPVSQVPGGVSHVTVSASRQSSSSWQAHTHVVGGSGGNLISGFPSHGAGGPGSGVSIGGPASSTTVVGAGTRSDLLDAIVGAASGRRPPSGPAPISPGGLGAIGSNGGSVSVSSGIVSGGVQPVQKHRGRSTSGAAAAGIAIGAVAGALALSALGTGIAGAIQSSRAGRVSSGGCPVSGCRRPCGRKRRSVPQSKVPAEVLDSIPMSFDRPY